MLFFLLFNRSFLAVHDVGAGAQAVQGAGGAAHLRARERVHVEGRRPCAVLCGFDAGGFAVGEVQAHGLHVGTGGGEVGACALQRGAGGAFRDFVAAVDAGHAVLAGHVRLGVIGAGEGEVAVRHRFRTAGREGCLAERLALRNGLRAVEQVGRACLHLVHAGEVQAALVAAGEGLCPGARADVLGACAEGQAHGVPAGLEGAAEHDVAHAGERGLVARFRDFDGFGEAHGHVVVGEVGRLREAVAVVRRAFDVERDAGHLAQPVQVEARPLHEDVLRALAEVDFRLAGLLAVAVVSRGHDLHPVVIAAAARQVVAVDVAAEGVRGGVHPHVVDDAGLAVVELEEGERLLAQPEPGVVGIAELHGEVVRAVVAVAVAGHVVFAGGVVHRELVGIEVVLLDVGRPVIGDGVAARPVAPRAVALAQAVEEPGVVLVAPLVGFLVGRHAHAALAVEHRAAVLRVVDERRPVGGAGEVHAAFVVLVLEREDAEFVVLLRDGAHGAAEQQCR